MRQAKTQPQKTKQGGKAMQNQQPQQAINVMQTCQPNTQDKLYLYLQENALTDLAVCISPADTTDLTSKSFFLFPYLKAERSFLRITYPCRVVEITGKEIIAISMFTYKKKLIYDQNTKRISRRFVKEGNMVSIDICVLMPHQDRYYPFIVEGFRSKLNAVKAFLAEKRQKGLLHPLMRIKHTTAKNPQGMEYPTFIIDILGEHELTEKEQRLYNILRGHFQWRLGLQPFSPLYPPEVKQELEEEEEDMNDVESDELLTDF